MMHRWVVPFGCAVALWFLASSAPAEEILHYQVEVIVFAQPNPQPTEAWHWQDADAPVARAVSLHDAQSRELGLVPVSADGLQGVADTLQRAGYRIVSHTAWVQPGLDPAHAIGVHLRGQGSDGLLDGVATLKLSRYLHLAADLRYGSATNADDARRWHYLHETRRVRLKELHYFDHPYFGMVARITRAP